MVVVIILGVVLSFVPTAIAAMNGHRHLPGIFILNLFLGWTLIGWVVALVWAVSPPASAQPVVIVQPGQEVKPVGGQEWWAQ
jgi:hypothetical protein